MAVLYSSHLPCRLAGDASHVLDIRPAVSHHVRAGHCVHALVRWQGVFLLLLLFGDWRAVHPIIITQVPADSFLSFDSLPKSLLRYVGISV